MSDGAQNDPDTYGFNPFSGAGAPSRDHYFANLNQVHKSDKPEASKGTTNLTAISGQIDGSKPGETYVEIKGPATLGPKSGITYSSEVLSAKKKAEQAINRQKIPKKDEKRVRQYFDSLTHG